MLVRTSNLQMLSDKSVHLNNVLFKSVIAVINNFEQISCINFKDKNELVDRLYQHWQPAYYRIRYHISNISSVYDIVLQEFGHLHEIVRRAITPFAEMSHCDIPDEEVAFLTVLFGGWLTREGVINQLKAKKIAIVVCENSATVATYLYLTLQMLLPELHFAAAISKREFEHYQRYYDVVFSTTDLITDKIHFTINPALNAFQKNAFRHQVISTLQGIDPAIIQIDDLIFHIERHSTIFDKKGLHKSLSDYLYHQDRQPLFSAPVSGEAPSLADLLSIQFIQVINDKVTDWQDAIKIAAKPLISARKIQPCYSQQMIAKSIMSTLISCWLMVL